MPQLPPPPNMFSVKVEKDMMSWLDNSKPHVSVAVTTCIPTMALIMHTIKECYNLMFLTKNVLSKGKKIIRSDADPGFFVCSRVGSGSWVLDGWIWIMFFFLEGQIRINFSRIRINSIRIQINSIRIRINSSRI